jgi:DNA-binding NarL/FixJ family response regulator
MGAVSGLWGSDDAGACPSCGALLPYAVGQEVVAAAARADTLTPREVTVFRLLGLGYGNRSIARELGLSERTVKRHVTSILAKLRLESRLQAGLTALLVSPSAA